RGSEAPGGSDRGRTRRQQGDGVMNPNTSENVVLVVDDNVDGALLLADGLEVMGHAVLVAHDGDAALELLDRATPSSAVIDLSLPGMDGCELAIALRRRLGARVRLVALTGHTQRADRERTRAAGFDEYLVKPADL